MKRGTLAVDTVGGEDASAKRCRMMTPSGEEEREEEEVEEKEAEEEEEEERRDFVPLLADGFDASFQTAKNASSHIHHHVTHDTFAVAESSYSTNAVARGTYAESLLTDRRELLVKCLPPAMRKQCLRHNWKMTMGDDDILSLVHDIAHDGLARCDVATQSLCSHPDTLDFPNDYLNPCQWFYNDKTLQNTKTRYARTSSGEVTLSRLEALCVCVLMCGPHLARYGLGWYWDKHVSMREEADMTSTVVAVAVPLQTRHHCADKCYRYTLEWHEVQQQDTTNHTADQFVPAPQIRGHWRQEAITNGNAQGLQIHATQSCRASSAVTLLRRPPPSLQHTFCCSTLPLMPCRGIYQPCNTEPQAVRLRFIFWLRTWLRVGVTLHYRYLTPPYSWGTVKLLAIEPLKFPHVGLTLRTTEYAWETVRQHEWNCSGGDPTLGLCFANFGNQLVLTPGSFARAYLGWQVEQFLHTEVRMLPADIVTLIGMYFN